MPARASAAALAVMLAAATLTACGGRRGGLFRQFEYDEEIYLSLDGSATMYVNASLASLNALRGTSFDIAPNAPIDRAAVREFFTTPVARLQTLSFSRRSTRRFVHAKLQVDEVRRLAAGAPFAWSEYRFERTGDVYVYRQRVGPASGKDDPAGIGGELVAFRLHLPSKITFHNDEGPVERGNILTWIQPLAERQRGVPLEIEARMETQSILYRTLYLFGLTFVFVAASFAAIIWWIVKRGSKPAEV